MNNLYAIAPGSHYRKVDFHIHTPQSHDYKDKIATAKDIVEAALAAGLDGIAITDHNDFRFVDSVKQAATGTNLIVFPGVEISTRDGHILAILDHNKTGDDIRTVLISCGLRDDTQYGEPNTATTCTIDETADIIVKCGGLAIAAHVDGPKGFLKENCFRTIKESSTAKFKFHSI